MTLVERARRRAEIAFSSETRPEKEETISREKYAKFRADVIRLLGNEVTSYIQCLLKGISYRVRSIISYLPVDLPEGEVILDRYSDELDVTVARAYEVTIYYLRGFFASLQEVGIIRISRLEGKRILIHGQSFKNIEEAQPYIEEIVGEYIESNELVLLKQR